MQRTSFRNGRNIYPVSVVDHKASGESPEQKAVKDLKGEVDELKESLADVAYSGSYNDLTDVPTDEPENEP